MMMRETGLAIAMLALGGCCGSARVSDTGYASMMVYGPQISACILDGDCDQLCADRFGLGDDVDIVRCEVTSIDRQAPGTSSGAGIHHDALLTKVAAQRVPSTSSMAGTVDDPSLVVGVKLRVTYIAPASCNFGVDIGAGDDEWSDDDWDNDSSDDSSDNSRDDDPDDDGGDDGNDNGGDDDGDTGDDGSDTGDDGGDTGDDGGDTGDDGGDTGDDGGDTGDDGGYGRGRATVPQGSGTHAASTGRYHVRTASHVSTVLVVPR